MNHRIIFISCFLISFNSYSSLPIELKREVVDGYSRLSLNGTYVLKNIKKMGKNILLESKILHDGMVERAEVKYKEYIKKYDLNPFARSTKQICAFVLRKMEKSGKTSNYNASSDVVFTRENVDIFNARWPIAMWHTTVNDVNITHHALFDRYGTLLVYRTEAFVPFSHLGFSGKSEVSASEISQVLANETHTERTYWNNDPTIPSYPLSSYVELEGNPNEFVFVQSASRKLAREFFSNNYIFPLQNNTVQKLLYRYKEDHGINLNDIDDNGSIDLLVIEATGSNEHNLVKVEMTIIEVSGADNYHWANSNLCLDQNKSWDKDNN